MCPMPSCRCCDTNANNRGQRELEKSTVFRMQDTEDSWGSEKKQWCCQSSNLGCAGGDSERSHSNCRVSDCAEVCMACVHGGLCRLSVWPSASATEHPLVYVDYKKHSVEGNVLINENMYDHEKLPDRNVIFMVAVAYK
jgi:hypothetical protein